MDPTEILNQAIEMQEKFQEFRSTCVTTINTYLEDLEKILNEGSKHSVEYKDRKIKETNGKIASTIKTFNEIIDKKLKDLDKWFEDQIEIVKTNIARKMISKTGVSPSTEMINKIAGTIPTPSLNKIKIELSVPEINLNDFEGKSNITLPRI